jgi:hypothetical protein
MARAEATDSGPATAPESSRRDAPAGGAPPGPPYSRIVAITLAYAALAALWILLSDRVVVWLLRDPAAVALANTLKGWLFVAVTATALFATLTRLFGRPLAAAPRMTPWRAVAWPLLLAGLAVAAVTAAAIMHALDHQRATEEAKLRTIVELKVGQLESWLRERSGDALFAQSSRYWADAYRSWRSNGDLAARDRLKDRIGDFRAANDYASITLFDPADQPLVSTATEAQPTARGARRDP